MCAYRDMELVYLAIASRSTYINRAIANSLISPFDRLIARADN